MNGFGAFYWKDGRVYIGNINFINLGEYIEDKKHKFGIYNGNEGKKYEGFWEIGFQKGLGKYSKRDGTYKLGIWDNSQVVSTINEDEINQKLIEIENLVEETNNRVQIVLERLRGVFKHYIPFADLDSLLEK